MKRVLFVLICILCLSQSSVIAEGTATPISSPEDLFLMCSDPDGDFVLTEDLYLPEDFQWEPIVFRGHLDGQGHRIYNVNPVSICPQTRRVYDGNYKEYDGVFAGLFGILDGAVVEDLHLTGAKIQPDPSAYGDKCLFAGLMAGLMDNGAILRSCSVQGTCAVSTSGRCFGTGGIAGYGSGRMEGCRADAVLICVDTDREFKDEQFMGGAYSAGFIDIVDCDIRVDGYDSDHGYVHNGGLVGMYIIYPKGTAYTGQILDTHVEGRIRFFEDNRDRRAYCAPFIGEVLQWTYEWGGCTENFQRDEVFSYDEDLMPCTHTAEWKISVTEPDYGVQGYTDYLCPVCGYTSREAYQAPLKQEIQLLDPAPIEEALQEAQQTEKKGLGIMGITGILLGAAIVFVLLLILGKTSK